MFYLWAINCWFLISFCFNPWLWFTLDARNAISLMAPCFILDAWRCRYIPRMLVALATLVCTKQRHNAFYQRARELSMIMEQIAQSHHHCFGSRHASNTRRYTLGTTSNTISVCKHTLRSRMPESEWVWEYAGEDCSPRGLATRMLSDFNETLFGMVTNGLLTGCCSAMHLSIGILICTHHYQATQKLFGLQHH